jgi:uncharacterized protein (TIGR02246 family)
VAEANRAFYEAFESRDLDRMAEVWERTSRAVCIHPGWPALKGWAGIATSWDAIFVNTPYIQFFLTDERVEVDGDVAWVTLSENILQAAGGTSTTQGTVAATNLFVRHDDGWRLVLHHGSPVGGPEQQERA